jgi:hypothetical protein
MKSKSLFVFALSFLAACTCGFSDTSAPNLAPEETSHVALNPTPVTPIVNVDRITPGHPDAAVYPPLPGSTTLANDVGDVVQRVEDQIFTLENKLMSLKVIPYSFALVPTTPFVVGPPNTFTSSTYTASIITLDIPDVQVGDDIKVTAWGGWQLNSSSSPGDVVGRARFRFDDDVMGGTHDAYPDGLATITDDGGNLTLPHNEQYSMSATHRALFAGTTRVRVQIATEDITGGAGTGTIILLFSARMDVDHVVNN